MLFNQCFKVLFYIQRTKITYFRHEQYFRNITSLHYYFITFQDPEKKSSKDKKKKGLGKLKHAETNSFIPLFREPSSVEKIFGDFEREQQKLNFRPPTPPEQPTTPPSVLPRVASPRAPAPRVASPRVTSPRAASPRIVHQKKEINYRPEPTVRNHHASATKIQAAYRGYMVSVHLLLLT